MPPAAWAAAGSRAVDSREGGLGRDAQPAAGSAERQTAQMPAHAARDEHELAATSAAELRACVFCARCRLSRVRARDATHNTRCIILHTEAWLPYTHSLALNPTS